MCWNTSIKNDTKLDATAKQGTTEKRSEKTDATVDFNYVLIFHDSNLTAARSFVPSETRFMYMQHCCSHLTGSAFCWNTASASPQAEHLDKWSECDWVRHCLQQLENVWTWKMNDNQASAHKKKGWKTATVFFHSIVAVQSSYSILLVDNRGSLHPWRSIYVNGVLCEICDRRSKPSGSDSSDLPTQKMQSGQRVHNRR